MIRKAEANANSMIADWSWSVKMGVRTICATIPFVIGGCLNPEAPGPPLPIERTMVLLPGIEGGAWQLNGTVRGLRQAGILADFDVIEWGKRPFGSLDNLTNLEANKTRAKQIAARIESHRHEYPERPITLIGSSGGGGLAILVAEALPRQPILDRLILIGAAISPRYELTESLARCKHGIVNMYSANDWLILGAGTSIFGTMDRTKSAAAGHVGFLDSMGNTRNENGLTQIAWQPRWAIVGHDGGHIGWLAGQWAYQYLAPVITKGCCDP